MELQNISNVLNCINHLSDNSLEILFLDKLIYAFCTLNLVSDLTALTSNVIHYPFGPSEIRKRAFYKRYEFVGIMHLNLNSLN